MSSTFSRGGRNVLANVVLVLALVSTFVVLGPAPQAEAQGAVPFDCDGTPYIMQQSRMYKVVPDPANPGNFLFEEVGTASNYGNSLGYDPTTNLVYGVRKVGGKFTVLTYDATWSTVNSQTIVEAPGSPTYPSTTGSSYAGTVSGDGKYLIATYNAAVPGSTKDNLWAIDASTGLATWIGPISPQNPRLADFAYNPADGYLYHVAGGQVQQLNPLTGAKTPLGATAGLGSGFGSSYFDAAGNLFVHRNNDGKLFKIGGVGTGTNTVTEVAQTPSVRGSDAASCVGEIDLLKDVVDAAGDPVPLADRVYAPGDIVTYEFTIINNALPAGPANLTLCDTLPADGRTYTGNASSSSAFSFTTPFGAGATDFCLSVTAPSSLWADPSQPGSPPVTITIDVELGADMLPGEYENQATLENPFDPGDLVNSDDPGDGSDPEDPTTIEVTGEFTVAKTVATHPGGNDTDSFTVVVTCRDNDGAPFDVAPTSIVDAVGVPWPGAGINTFPIADGETPRVIDLPAGSTCTAVESPIPPAYALTPASSDTVIADGGEIIVDEAPSTERVDLTNNTGEFSLEKFTFPPASVAAPLDLTGSFTIRVECRFNGVVVLAQDFVVNANTGDATGASGSLSYPDTPVLPDGAECVATELATPGWTSLSGPVSFTIKTDSPATAGFKNERQVAPLDISKLITGLPDGEDPNGFTFEVTVECTGGFADPSEKFGPFKLSTNNPVQVLDLPVGTVCTVVETPVQEFAPVYDPPGGVTTIEAAGGRVAIENVTGTFIVRKDTVVSTTLYPVDPTGDFTVRITCVDANGTTIHNEDHVIAATDTAPAAGATGGLTYEDATLPLLPPGTQCTVTEQVPAGWELTSPNGVVIDIGAEGVRPTAVLTNERVTADLTITKDVVGTPPGVDASTITFPVAVSCTGDVFTGPVELIGTISESGSFVVPSLPVGATCTATETANPAYVTSVVPATSDATIVDATDQEIAFTNETSWFTITKNTTVPAGSTVQDDARFSFDIVCGADTFPVSITTVNGTGTLAPADIPLLPTGTACVVTETALTDWTVAANDLPVTTSATPGEVTFTNTRKTGSLEITKTVDGLPAGATAGDFLVDVVCTGDFESTETPSTQQTFTGLTLTTAGVTIDDLPTGATCVVTEQTANGYTTTYPAGQSATIDETTTPVVDIVNTTSSFSITKATSAPAGTVQDAAFDFSWVCNDVLATTGSTTLTTASNAAATTFAGNGLPLLPPGTVCTVTETPVAGWTATALSIDVTTGSAADVAAFVNTRDVGSLEVTKSIVGLPSGADPLAFTFNLTIVCTSPAFATGTRTVIGTIQDDTTVTVNDLPVGADCNVEEADDPAWTPLYDPVGGDITIVPGQNDVTIVNSTGELVVFKENFVDSTHPIDPTGTFDFEIECTNGGVVNFPAQVIALDASTLTASGGAIGGIGYEDLGTTLAAGTVCTVTEQTPPTGWTIRTDLFPNPDTVNITADGGETAEFANQRDVADLTLTKEIVGLPDGVDPASFTFEVTVVCNNEDLPTDYTIGPIMLTPGTDHIIENLPTGASCVATETVDPRFAPTVPAAPTVVDDDGETLPIINTTRVLTIEKQTEAPGTFPVDLVGTFTFDVVCDNGYTTTASITTDAAGTGSVSYPTLDLIAEGTECTVTEQTPPPEWMLTPPNDVAETLTSDTTIAFTNTRKVGELEITKSIVGLPAGLTEPGFTVDIVCTGEFASTETPATQHTILGVALTTAGTTIANLPTGTSCVVEENPSNSYLPSYPDGDTRVIDPDGETVAIVNETSTFHIEKTIDAPTGVATNETFGFSWSCTDPANSTGTATITGAGTFSDATQLPLVPVGTDCTVTETTVPTGWTPTTASITMPTATGGPVVLSFENKRDLGTLKVTKTIQGFPTGFAPDLNDEEFDVTITCTGDFEASPAIYNDTISVNTPAIVPDLPTGAECSVVEAGDPRFFVVYTPTSTEIVSGENTLGVMNVTGELMVQKNTIVNSPHPIDPLGDFDVRIICSNAAGEYFNEIRTVTVDTQTGTNGSGGISYDDLPLFSDGSDCTAEEVNIPTGWTETSDSQDPITIDNANPQTAVFENTRDVGSLTITKAIAGLPADVDPTSFTFMVTVTCDSPDLPANYMVGPFEVGVGMDHVIEGLPTDASCTAAEEADPRFAPTLPADPTIITTDGETLPILNTTTHFSITKTASTTSPLPIDLAQTFPFTIVCGTEAPVMVVITTAPNGLGSLDYTDGLPFVAPGTECTVTETAPALWTETSTIPPFTAAVGVTPELAFTNERDLFDLTVTKDIVGLPSPLVDADYDFEITITCTGGFSTLTDTYEETRTVSTDGTVTLTGIPADANCVVVENLPADSPFIKTMNPPSGAVDLDADATVEITNTTSTFEITKSTVVVGDAEEDATFDFAWTCNDVAGSAGTATITTVDGEGVLDFADGLAIVPPGTECVVDETSLPAGWVVTETPLTVTTAAAAPATAAFENTRTAADLTITKSILGLAASDDPADTFTFIVDITCTGDFPGGTFELLGEPISTVMPITVPNLPTDAVCKVVERPDPSFAAIYGPEAVDGVGGEATITDQGAGVAITNLTGRVAWVKQTVAAPDHPVDPVETFTFLVECTNDTGTTVLFMDTVPVTTSTLTAAGAVGIPNEADFPLLPAGSICTIEENPVSTNGWTLTSLPNPVVLTISPDPAPGQFTNTRDDADLTINKVIEGLPAGLDATDYSFDVTITCDHADLTPSTGYAVGPLTIATDMPITVANLPTGADCTVVETTDADFQTTYTDQQVIIAEGVTTTITNSTGSLKISKQAEAPGSLGIDLSQTFLFDVMCDSGDTANDVAIVTDATGVGSIEYPDLNLLIPEGAICTVTEQADGDWIATAQSVDVTITNGTAEAEFVNTRKTAPLTVIKLIDGEPAGADLDNFGFDINITCTGDFATGNYATTGAQVSVNTNYSLNDLPTGAQCEVEEVADPRFATSYSPDPANVEIVETTGAEVTITNSTGELIIAKQTIIPAGRPVDPTGEFGFQIDCVTPTGGSVFSGFRTLTVDNTAATPTGATGGLRYDMLPLMPDGTTCTISETALPSGWELSSPNGVVITISSTDPETASFTNTRQLGTLRVEKELAGLPLGATGQYDDEEFTVAIECTGDFVGGTYTTTSVVSVNTALEIDELPTGATCTITEAADARFTPSYLPQTVTIGEGGALSEITNTTGELVLMKETFIPSTHPINAVEPFEFRLLCTAPGSPVATLDLTREVTPGTGTQTGAIGGIRYDEIPLLADGTECTVSEENLPADWTLTFSSPMPIVIDSSAPITATFVNTHDVGDLLITKTTLGLPPEIAASSLTFTGTVVCNHHSLPTDYPVDFTITGDGTALIEALPANAVCTVTEDQDTRFDTAYTPANPEVTIVKDDVVDVGIENETSYFDLQKTVVTPGNVEINLQDDFTFDVVCTNGFSGEFILSTDATGTATITHVDGLPLLPPTAACEITEPQGDLPNGWVYDTPADGSFDLEAAADDRGVVEFTNRRQETTLTVTKTIEGLPGSVPITDPTFPVTVTCNGDFVNGDTQEYTGTIGVSSDFVISNLPTDAICNVDEGFAPAYATATDPASGTTQVPFGGASVEVINSTATFVITKQTQTSSGLPIDIDAAFTFDYVCTNAGGAEIASGTTVVTTVDGTGQSNFDTPGSNALPQLPTGTTCVVTERPLTNWTPVGDTEVTLVLDSDEEKTAAFVNDRDLAELTVEKKIDGLPASETASDYEFEIEVMCMGDFTTPGGIYVVSATNFGSASPVTVSGLPIGAECTVVEDPDVDSRFVASYSPATGTATIDGDTTIIVTNTTSTFDISKATFAPTRAEDDATFSFDWSCNDADNTTGTASITTADGEGEFVFDPVVLVAPGTICTVDESSLPTGWTVAASPIEVTTTATEAETAAFTNTRAGGELTITKTVLGLDPAFDPAAESYAFFIDIRCTGDFPGGELVLTDQEIRTNAPITILDLPTGAECTVVEQPDPTFSTIYGPASADGLSGEATITTAGAGVAITNLTGRVAWVKQTIVPPDHPVTPVATFEFALACTTPNGDVIQPADPILVTTSTLTAAGAVGVPALSDLPLLPVNTTCTVTEIGPGNGWTLTSTPNPVNITISTTPDAGVFENTRDTATLTINKQIEGLPASESASALAFDVTVTCDHPDLTPSTGYVLGPMEVRTDAPISIANLPTGADCRISEAPTDEFETTYVNERLIIAPGATSTIINRTATFEINKTTTVDSPLAIDPDDEFTFNYTCTNSDGDVIATGTTSITTDGGTGTVGFDPLPYLANGTECRIVETPTTNWTPVGATDITVILRTGETVSADFVNDRDLTSLTIRKEFDGLPAVVDPNGFSFPVAVVCTNGFAQADGTDTETIATQISTVAPTVIDGLPIDANCTVTEAADSRFVTSYEPTGGVVDLTAPTNVTVTNTTSTFGITKKTFVAPGLEDDATFAFDWSCNDALASSGTASITTNSSVGAFSFGPNAPLVVPGTQCVVDETTLPPGWTVDSSPLQVITSNEQIETADFVNRRTAANLTITKTVLGLPDGQLPSQFSFRVDVTCTGDFPGGALALTNQVLTPGVALVIPNLPTGAECTVVEQPDPAFSVVYGPASGTVTIGDEGAGVSVANLTGRVSFLKQTIVADPQINASETFQFDVTCINPATGEVLFDAIVPITTDTLTAAGGIGVPDEANFPLLAAGSECTIAELGPPTGWTLAPTSTNPATVTISTTPEVVVFDNIRDVADLEITKEIVGLPATETSSIYSFDVLVSCVHPDLPQPSLDLGPLPIRTNQPINIGNLPTGAECTVTEVADARFRTSYDDNVVTITDAGAAVAITNTTGVLEINKRTIVPGSLPISRIDTFTFDVECANDYTGTFTTTTDATGVATIAYPTIDLIADGTLCTVSETPLTTGWTPVTPTLDATILNGQAQVDFTNNRDVADLTISKVVDGVPTNVDLSTEQFGIAIECTGDFVGGVYTRSTTVTATNDHVVRDVPTGAVCSVVETADPRFATTYAPASGELVIDVDSQIEITNTTSTLEIQKQTIAAAGVDADGTFDFEWTCGTLTGTATITTVNNTGSWTIADGLPLVPPGTVCDVLETNLPAGWVVGQPLVNLVTDDEEINQAQFLNTRSVGELVISKTVIGLDPSELPEARTFFVDILCTGEFDTGTTLLLQNQPLKTNEPIVVSDLPTGTICTVTERPDPDFRTIYSPADPTVEITTSGAAVAITNLTGQVSLIKQSVVAGPYDLNPVAEFLFDIECSNGDTFNSVAIETTEVNASGAVGVAAPTLFGQLPEGTTCTITEQAAPGWTGISDNVQIVTVSSSSTDTAQFENVRDRADLRITKEIDGLPAGQLASSYQFEVTVVCTQVDPMDADITVGPLVLSTTQTTVVPNLPTGALCTVTETPDDRFAVSYDQQTVTIAKDAGADVQITNTTGELLITKTALAAGALPINLADTFTFDVECRNPANVVVLSEIVQISTDVNGLGSVTYPDIGLIADGNTCTVTETNLPTGWTTASDVESTSISGGNGIVAFTNNRSTAPFEVSKVVNGTPAGVDLSAELFEITVTCTGDFVAGEYQTVTEIAEDAAFTLANVPTGASCKVVETGDIRFATTYTPGAGTVTVGATGGEVEVINNTAFFSIAKETTFTSGLPVDADGTFTFMYACTFEGTIVASGTVDVTTVASAGDSQHPELPLVPSGSSCVVTESAAALFTPVGSTVVTLDAVTNSPAAFEFTNDRNVGSLTISKQVIGLPDTVAADELSFTIDVRCTDGFTGTNTYESLGLTIGTDQPVMIDGLPEGATCEVAEIDDRGFAPSYAPASPAGIAAVTIAQTGSAVSIVNATGEILLVKQTTAPTTYPIDTTGEFEFEITCRNAAGVVVFDEVRTVSVTTPTASGSTGVLRYADLPLLAEGTVCSATEINVPAEWSPVDAGPQDVTVSSNGSDPDVLSFENVRETGSITLTNTLFGLPAGANPADYSFTLTLSCFGSGFPNGYEISVEVNHGESITIDDLPIGVVCSVVQVGDQRFAPEIPSGPFMVSAGAVASIDVVNRTGTISITKTASTKERTRVPTLAETFTFQVSCENGYDATHTVTTNDDGEGSGVWPELPLLASGTSCTVEELELEGWENLGDVSIAATIVTGETQQVDFANEYQLGDPIRPVTVVGTSAAADPVAPADLPPAPVPATVPLPQPLALTGRESRDIAMLAWLLLGLGFSSVGLSRRRGVSPLRSGRRSSHKVSG